MPKKKLPYMQFYTGDWIKDTRHLSQGAKGAWIDLICGMWDAPQRGSLTDTIEGYARRIGATVNGCSALIDELTDPTNPVCERENLGGGKVRLTCRRIIRDERKRAQSVRHGRLGGNPSVIYGVNPPDNPQDKATPPAPLVSNTGSDSLEEEMQEGKGFPPIPDPLLTPEFRAAWFDFVNHRREIRHPVTPIAVRNLFVEFLRMGPEKSVSAIRTSIKNGWQGVFEDRKQSNHKSSKADEQRQRVATLIGKETGR